MKFYEKGDKVRLEDDSIATVVEVRRGSYAIPAGQQLGGGGAPSADGATVQAGEASYTVKTAKGKTIEVRDRDVRNPPKADAAKSKASKPRKRA